MLFADGDALPPQLPPWVAVVLALGGVSGIAGGVAVLVAAYIRVKRYYFGERQQTIRQQNADRQSAGRQQVESENRIIKQYSDLYERERERNNEADRLHREEVDAMDKAHAAEVELLRREVADVRDEHADCRVRVARLEEALRGRGWDFPEDPRRPAMPPELREQPPDDPAKTDPRGAGS